jgi:hypothetical protein
VQSLVGPILGNLPAGQPEIRWIPAKATCLPSSVLVVTFCVPSVKGEHEFVSGFRAGL